MGGKVGIALKLLGGTLPAPALGAKPVLLKGSAEASRVLE